jgi:hypothetical protein
LTRLHLDSDAVDRFPRGVELLLTSLGTGRLWTAALPGVVNTRRTRIAQEGQNAETAMAQLNEMLRRRVAARERVDADRADTRARIEIDYGKGKRRNRASSTSARCSIRPKMKPSTGALPGGFGFPFGGNRGTLRRTQ